VPFPYIVPINAYLALGSFDLNHIVPSHPGLERSITRTVRGFRT